MNISDTDNGTRRQETFETRFTVYTEAPQECLTRYLPFDRFDGSYFVKNTYLTFLSRESTEPNMVPIGTLFEILDIINHVELIHNDQ